MSTSDSGKQLIPYKPSEDHLPGAGTDPFLSEKDLNAELEHTARESTGDDSRSTGKEAGDNTARDELGETDVAGNASIRGSDSLRERFTGSRAKGRSSTLPVLAEASQERPAHVLTRRGTVSGCVDASEQGNLVGGEQCMSRRTTATDANHSDRTIPAVDEPEDKRMPDIAVLRETAKVEQHDAADENVSR